MIVSFFYLSLIVVFQHSTPLHCLLLSLSFKGDPIPPVIGSKCGYSFCSQITHKCIRNDALKVGLRAGEIDCCLFFSVFLCNFSIKQSEEKFDLLVFRLQPWQHAEFLPCFLVHSLLLLFLCFAISVITLLRSSFCPFF